MHLYRTLSFALTLLLISSSLSLQAQEANKKKTATERDSIQLFRGASVHYNLAGTIIRMVSDYGEMEAAVKVNLKDRYFPTVELGLGSAKHETDAVTGITAKTNAPFFRLGCDFNISRNKHDAYRVLAGLRYGFTHFTQKAYGDIKDPYWGGTLPYYAETSRSYHWAELIFALDGRLWGPVRLGWSFRYKVPIYGKKNTDGQDLWYIPGFGKSGNKIGATFNVGIELWRKNKKLTDNTQ